MGNLPLPEATSALFLVFGGNRTQAQKFFGRKSGKNNKVFIATQRQTSNVRHFGMAQHLK